MVERRLTGAEVLGVSATCALAAPILVAYTMARVAGGIHPVSVLVFSGLSIVLVVLSLRGHASWHGAEIITWAAVVLAAIAAALALAWPALLPVGAGPDLAHHLVLIDFIERHWIVVTGPGAEARMGEMSHYTPGLHLLAALAGVWTRTDGLHAVHVVVAVSVALKGGFVFLIARRLVPSDTAHVPTALTAVVLSCLPNAYTIGSFGSDSFFAQVVAELFAVVMWWSVVAWADRPWPGAMAICALAGTAAFLTWPVWIGPPLLTALIVLATRHGLSMRERLSQAGIVLAPVALVTVVYAADRLGWLRMAAATGAAAYPSPAAYGWVFLLLPIAGFVYAATIRRARVLLIFAGAVILQAAALYALARWRGADTPYMALKMFYLLVYPQSVAAALLLGAVCTRSRMPRQLAWALMAVVALIAGWRLTDAPRRGPVVSEELWMAGRWARTQVEATCVDYLVGSSDAGYWLHLAMLGNSRSDPRTLDDKTFEPREAFGRWILPGGLRYAIVDWTVAPREIRSTVDTLAQFGNVSVVSRRGPSRCP